METDLVYVFPQVGFQDKAWVASTLLYHINSQHALGQTTSQIKDKTVTLGRDLGPVPLPKF